MFGGAGPALGYLLGLTSPGELMSVIDKDAMYRQHAARHASEELAQIKACMLPRAMLKDKKAKPLSVFPGSSNFKNIYNPKYVGKPKSFKEKLQEETDEWLDKVLD